MCIPDALWLRERRDSVGGAGFKPASFSSFPDIAACYIIAPETAFGGMPWP
jgi:hypothetical protein